MTAPKLKRYDHQKREAKGGRYRKTPPCDGCGKPVGTAWFTDEEVCGGSDGPGFYVCERATCAKRLDGKTVDERRAIYETTRAAS